MGLTYNFEIIAEVTRNNVSGDPRRFDLAAGGILPPVTVILCSCQDVCIVFCIKFHVNRGWDGVILRYGWGVDTIEHICGVLH